MENLSEESYHIDDDEQQIELDSEKEKQRIDLDMKSVVKWNRVLEVSVDDDISSLPT